MTPPDLLIVAPYAGGHHAEYLRWIVGGLATRDVGRIAVAAHPVLLDAESDALAAVDTRALDVSPLAAPGSLWAAGRAVGAVVGDAIRAARAAQVFLPALDHTQLALATGLRFEVPTRVSGILLRATLHEPATGLGDRISRLRKTALLRLAARNPHLGAVLALDPDAVAPLRRLGLDARWLPDPVETPAPGRSAGAVRASLGVEDGRTMLLLFGSLEVRKGVFDVLEALTDVPDEAARRLALVVVGKTYDDMRPRLRAAVDAARQTAAHVVFQERFVPDGELDDLVTAADVVLAPYRGHVGSSGVVLRAAAAGRPLLATAEGMVGREVRAHALGQAVDTADRAALAAALATAAAAPDTGFAPARAAAYAEAHAVDRFADVIAAALRQP
ncbi:glycosyltransferase [Rubrivirga sp. IMCC45206]|uniref:glycosyltransferase n=1 Tax=Rubrivirga sp. IMCC45206 TaxID=3391614 RepID=UPI00398FA33B